MSSWKGRDLITTRGLKRAEIEEVLDLAEKMDKIAKGKERSDKLREKVLATLFYEPSTRTHLSFCTAMQRLDGNVIGFTDPRTTSTWKGETIADTIRLVEHCADAIVIRHPNEGTAALCAKTTEVPVINAGDGSNQHPTQAMLDLYTIRQKFGKIDGLTVMFVGDLKYGRTIKALSYALTQFDDVTIQLHSPPALRLPPAVVNELRNSVKVKELDEMDLSGADVVYATRIQKERFPDPEEYKKYGYVIDAAKAETMKENAIIMHPLPRVDEIATDVDSDKRAWYFKQEANGIPVRMALLDLIIGGK